MSRNPHHRAGHGRRVSLLAALLLVLGAPAAHAVSFRLASQNCLHLGWGAAGYQNNKADALEDEFDDYDVVLLQEVMATANLGAVTPGGFVYIPGTAPQQATLRGSTNYKEAYVILMRTGGAWAPVKLVSPTNAQLPQFTRPPMALVMRTGATYTWVVDFHAIFGKRKAQRNAEATTMAAFVTALADVSFPGPGGVATKTNRIVIGGDWNLPTTATGFNALRALGAQIQPNTRTSLKANGGLSQPYDHFAWTPSVTVNNAQSISPLPLGYSNQGWRQNVSDHLGISCDVDY